MRAATSGQQTWVQHWLLGSRARKTGQHGVLSRCCHLDVISVALPLQGSFFTKNSSSAIHPPPTRTITVLRRIRTSRSCWESPNCGGEREKEPRTVSDSPGYATRRSSRHRLEFLASFTVISKILGVGGDGCVRHCMLTEPQGNGLKTRLRRTPSGKLKLHPKNGNSFSFLQ
jgi:hypothetical protein